MSDKERKNKTPSEELSVIAVAKLIESGLVLAADSDVLEKDLAAGKVKTEDWRLFIEKAIDKETSDEQ